MCLLLPGHLDTQQRPRGGQHQHRVGVSQQAGHHWRWGVTTSLPYLYKYLVRPTSGISVLNWFKVL